MALAFGPQFMKGMLGGSRGIVASLLRRARATIGRISLKLTANVKSIATRMVRRLGMGGVGFARVGGEWQDVGLVARTKASVASSRVGKAFHGAPRHLEVVQDKLMARFGNHPIVQRMDRIGAWGGSFANRFNLEEQLGSTG